MSEASPTSSLGTIAVSGAAGLVGRALCKALVRQGYTIKRLVRRQVQNPSEIEFNIDKGRLNSAALEGALAVVHLAGEPIASGRWSAAKKDRIRNSRIHPTRMLAGALSGLANPPQTFISASAIGYYGDRGAEELDETSPAGSGFLPDVCQQWEAATEPAKQRGIRTVLLRTGIVLSPKGGALRTMLLPFKLGLGGVLGTGEQYFSWIALDDEVSAIQHALGTSALSGPVNLTTPNPVTNREFTKTLGRVIGRPTFLPAPAFAMRLALGEMADALLLASARVLPKKLLASGYAFQQPNLEAALKSLLAK